MQGHIVTTEVGYTAYVGNVEVADVGSIDEAVAAIKQTALPWNGSITRNCSPSMPCA